MKTVTYWLIAFIAIIAGSIYVSADAAKVPIYTATATALRVTPVSVKVGSMLNTSFVLRTNLPAAKVTFSYVAFGTTSPSDDHDVVPTLNPGKAATVTYSELIPVGTPPGLYVATAYIQDVSGTKYATASATFKVVAASVVVTPPPIDPPPVTTTPPILALEPVGPSQSWFNNPPYVCKSNFYVSTTGSDTSGLGTKASPWATIQKANSGRLPGDCVNVADGLYQGNIQLTMGGDAPLPDRYVVYRCQDLDKCHVLAPSSGGHLWNLATPANFVMIDGFEIDGNSTSSMPDGVADTCVGSSHENNGSNPAPNNDSVHHVWVLNSLIHHCNLAGIGFNETEYHYSIHNKVYHNSWTSGYEGSGIGYVVAMSIQKGDPNSFASTTSPKGTGYYTPSGMDLTWYPPYHNVIAFNDISDNSEAKSSVKCGSHTDGNGIIIDTFLDQPTNTVPYLWQTLVFGNVSYLNGGRGIHVFSSKNVTVSQNTVYGNGRDTCNPSYVLGDLSQQGGTNNVWSNNVSYTIQTQLNTSVAGCTTCGGRNSPFVAGNGRGMVDANNTYSGNFLFGGLGPQGFDAEVGVTLGTVVDPQFVDAVNSNFALKSTSPAIKSGACGLLSKCP